MLNALPSLHLRRFLGGLAVCAAGLLATEARGATPAAASSGRDSKEEAIESIPFDKLTPDTRAKLRDVVTKPSIYRRLPTQAVECNPDLYLFLIRYPEVIVNIWELMGITNVSAKRTGPFTLNTSDGAGTVSSVELVYGTPEVHVLYCEGTYEGPLFKRKINGKCVMLLKSGYTRDKDDRVQITNRLDMFLQLDNVGADILAKTLHPLVGKSADHNFVETAQFVGRVSQAAERNTAGFQKMTGRLTSVDPTVRQRFAEIAGVMNAKALERDGLAIDTAPAAAEAPGEVIRSAALEEEPRKADPARRITVPR